MGQISPDYASPGLRVGLFLTDHPDGRIQHELVSGAELNIPEEFGGKGNFCRCNLSWDGEVRATAWKPVPAKGDAEVWNVICTKTTGRALKKAGYPDDLVDLKALVLWRQRQAEIQAISAGTAHTSQQALPSASQLELGSGDDELSQALDKAATSTPDGKSGDEDLAGSDGEPDERSADVLELLDGLSPADDKVFTSFCATIGAPTDPYEMTSAQIDDVLNWLDPIDG